MGIESNGMLLAASADNGEPVLLTPQKEVPPGAEIR
jgi:tRNA-binding EMAP/Myf-like protein